MPGRGLFVGLVTLDLIYLTEALPNSNEKIVALDYSVAAGGPATNAAITFAYLGNSSHLLGVVGGHPMGHLIRSDLETGGITLTDLLPEQADPPPTSSIFVTRSTGERAVVSLNAVRSQAGRDRIPPELWQILDRRDIEVVLIDGHQMDVGCAIAQQARQHQIPVVVDGGSWKPGFEEVLRQTDYAICSANFLPPGCASGAEVLAYLQQLGVPHSAVTNGEQPIQFISQGMAGQIPIPQTTPVDTVGAGDVLHGAFCHYLLQRGLQRGFEPALADAAKVASYACQFFGTRSWMAAPPDPP